MVRNTSGSSVDIENVCSILAMQPLRVLNFLTTCHGNRHSKARFDMWFFDWIAGLFGIARGELFIYLGLGLLGLSFLSDGSNDWDDGEGSSVDKTVDRQNFEQNNYYKK